jgi:protocatechuate 3,4-dioxygenase beta subunit
MTISRRTAIGQIAARAAIVPLGGSLLISSSALGARSPTPFTDIGPFYPMVKPADEDGDLTMIGDGRRAEGKVIEIAGRLLDGRGAPLAGSRIEIWQANAAGRYAHRGDLNPRPLDPAFQGFGVVTTDAKGNYRFVTIKPGAYPIPGGVVRPPHIHLDVSGRNDRLITQMLFPGDPLNDKDIVLANVDRSLLVAADRGLTASGAQRFEWDIILANG